MSWIIMKSAGDDYNFTAQRVPGKIGHTYEYAQNLAAEVTEAMKQRAVPPRTGLAAEVSYTFMDDAYSGRSTNPLWAFMLYLQAAGDEFYPDLLLEEGHSIAMQFCIMVDKKEYWFKDVPFCPECGAVMCGYICKPCGGSGCDECLNGQVPVCENCEETVGLEDDE